MLATSDYPDLPSAWSAFAASLDHPPPPRAAIAIAAPLTGAVVRMTNNSWTFAQATLADALGVAQLTLVNDFEAIAHAIDRAPATAFDRITGPGGPLPERGAISIVGPGTGLGVACLHRHAGGVLVQATEGGHIGLAPCNPFEDALLLHLRARYGRVSVERACSGPGIVAIYETLAMLTGADPLMADDRAIWTAALSGSDPLAAGALDRFCALLGSLAGDMALAHGAAAVVLAGGLGQRLAAFLPGSGFAAAFEAKGRYRALLAGMPVKLVSLPEPGLYGAAAAFLHQHGVPS